MPLFGQKTTYTGLMVRNYKRTFFSNLTKLFDFWILAVSTLAPSMTKRNVLRWIRETSREFFKNKIKILHNPIEVNSSNLSTFYFTNFFKVLKIHFSLQIFPHSFSHFFFSFENSLFSEKIKKSYTHYSDDDFNVLE